MNSRGGNTRSQVSPLVCNSYYIQHGTIYNSNTTSKYHCLQPVEAPEPQSILKLRLSPAPHNSNIVPLDPQELKQISPPITPKNRLLPPLPICQPQPRRPKRSPFQSFPSRLVQHRLNLWRGRRFHHLCHLTGREGLVQNSRELFGVTEIRILFPESDEHGEEEVFEAVGAVMGFGVDEAAEGLRC